MRPPDMSDSQASTLYALAESHAHRGDWPQARQAYLDVLALCPSHVDALLQLSYLESISGSYRRAESWAERAAELKPRHGEPAISLIRRLRTFNRAEALAEVAEELMADPQAESRVLVELAMQLSNINDHGRALACAQQAAAHHPADALARMVRGQMLAQHGLLGEAQADFEWVLSRRPRLASVWWSLSRLRRQTDSSNHVRQLQQLLASPLSPIDTAAAAFALHKELDDLGDAAGAWRALEQGCAAKRSTLQYETNATRNLFDALIEMPVGPLVDVHRTTPVPIFIVGMHRSGTTLLEQLLSANPQVRAIGELYDFTAAMRFAADHHCRGIVDDVIVSRAPSIDFESVGSRYLRSLDWRVEGSAFFTDKLPSNFLNIGFIRQALPHARILHLVRNPIEVCFSNLRELFSDANAYSYDQHELAAYYLQYLRLMRHWRDQWPDAILDVDYARLTVDPASSMREVAEFCGMPYIDGMASTHSTNRAVATASAVQVRGEVAARKAPRWAPYEKYLEPLIVALRAGGAID